MTKFPGFEVSAATATKLDLVSHALEAKAARPAEGFAAGCNGGPNVGCGGGSQGCYYYQNSSEKLYKLPAPAFRPN